MAVQRTLLVNYNDTNGKIYEKQMTHANPSATATNIDAFSRALIGLTTNTYQDTIIREEQSVNEILAE